MTKSDTKKCEQCGAPIPKLRLQVLPHTTTCVKCSTEKSRIGVMADIAGSLELQMSDPTNDYMQSELHNDQ